MAGDRGRASLCDIAGGKHDKADIKGVQIQPPGVLRDNRGAWSGGIDTSPSEC
jgi:hypothetical protein